MMKELTFTEKIEREDWEPLFGKWYIHIPANPVFDGVTLYHIVPTEIGFALYWRNTVNCCPYEDYQQFGEFREYAVNRKVSEFVSLLLQGMLKIVEKTDVEEVENLMAELEIARNSMIDCNKNVTGMGQEITERISSLIDHN